MVCDARLFLAGRVSWLRGEISDRARCRRLAAATVVPALAAAAGACGEKQDHARGATAAAQDGGVNGSVRVVLDAGKDAEPPPAGEDACPPGDCNYQVQAGCSADQACRPRVTVDGGLEPGCEAIGAAAAGEPCQQWTDCGRGHLCAAGVCRRLCCGGDWQVCPDGETCSRELRVEVEGVAIPAQVQLCFPVDNCDVLDPQACGSEPDLSCLVVDARGNSACLPSADRGVGERCSSSESCSAGLICVDPFVEWDGGLTHRGEYVCRRLCRAEEGGAPFCLDEAEACVHYDRDPPGVGECVEL